MAEGEASAAGSGTPAADPSTSEPRPSADATSILFVGDVVGGIGRRTLLECLAVLRERHAPTFVVVNGENAAGGLGITPKIAEEMFANGVDAITLGNHTYHRREIYPYLDSEKPIVRPANFLRSRAGGCAWSSAMACASAWST
jgi:calcineurin-like phosphoesterase